MSAANPNASGGYPADDMYVEPRRIDRDEEEKLVQRLYYQQMELAQQREAERMETLRRSRPQPNSRSLSKEDEERMVSRMYDEQIQRHAAAKEEQQRKSEEERARYSMKLDSSSIDDQVKRVYDDEVARGQERKQELDQRYHPTKEPKKVPKGELQAAVERLYHVDYEKRDEELFKKYVYPHDPKCSRISKDDEASMATRLSTTK